MKILSPNKYNNALVSKYMAVSYLYVWRKAIELYVMVLNYMVTCVTRSSINGEEKKKEFSMKWRSGTFASGGQICSQLSSLYSNYATFYGLYEFIWRQNSPCCSKDLTEFDERRSYFYNDINCARICVGSSAI